MLSYRKSVGALLFAALVAGCETAPKTEEGKANLEGEVELTMKRISASHSWVKDFLDKSEGYVVFPQVGKGGLVVGGAYGRGIVYDTNGVAIGYSDISQGTVGLQAGGQTFAEIIAFETARDLDRFKAGKFTFNANASAVALKSGAATTAKYTDGVAIFVDPIGGLMAEASVGGQSFTYLPK